MLSTEQKIISEILCFICILATAIGASKQMFGVEFKIMAQIDGTALRITHSSTLRPQCETRNLRSHSRHCVLVHVHCGTDSALISGNCSSGGWDLLVLVSLTGTPEYGGGATAAELELDERPKSLLKRLGLGIFSSAMFLGEANLLDDLGVEKTARE